ncbi:MAG: rod shape-determining protein [Lachnospiraceae bacterium]|nr:rod shape-determining protein [Lachnospiraceae bacterium]
MDEARSFDNMVFGLDIGTRSVVGTVGYRKPTGEFIILAQKSACHETRAMLDGQIHDIGKVADTVCHIKYELEKELDMVLDKVCIAAAGRVLKTVKVRMDYDLGDDMAVTEDMVYAMELMGMEQAHAKLRSEEKDGTEYFCVGYSIVKYYLGNVQLTNLEGHRGSKIAADVLATFLPRDVIDGLYSVCDRAGLKVLNLTLEPIAAINVAIPEKFRLLNLALVDIGAGTSDICITKEGSITGYGMLPCAGDYLTESIMYELLTDFATAEQVKLDFSEGKDDIPYIDVMGTKQTVAASKIHEVLAEPFKKLSKLIADKILELNGGERVGAVFIVGGGGKNPEFAKLLSEAIGLPEQRVALRGEEVFTRIVTPDNVPINDPMLVTPIGICLNYYEQNNNFIIVKMNGVDIKLYDNGKLNVMDAVISSGMGNADIFPKKGKDLTFMVNGKERVIKGQNGESAFVMVNGEECGVITPVKCNDIIIVKESTAGADGHIRAGELEEYKKGIFFIVNGKQVRFERKIRVNGREEERDYEISEGDNVEIHDYYNAGELFKKLDIPSGHKVILNNRTLDPETADPYEKIYENYIIDIVNETEDSISGIVKNKSEEGPALKTDAGDDPKLKDQYNELVERTRMLTEELSKMKKAGETPISKDVPVMVNNVQVLLQGKSSYTFVDVLDFYPFNTSALLGSRIVCKRNGTEADFFTPVADGDMLELFWE